MSIFKISTQKSHALHPTCKPWLLSVPLFQLFSIFEMISALLFPYLSTRSFILIILVNPSSSYSRYSAPSNPSIVSVDISICSTDSATSATGMHFPSRMNSGTSFSAIMISFPSISGINTPSARWRSRNSLAVSSPNPPRSAPV